jgi:hypothetical protein
MARGHVYFRSDKAKFHCFNCKRTRSVKELIEQVDSRLMAEYFIESTKGRRPDWRQEKAAELPAIKMEKPVFKTEFTVRGIPCLDELDEDHPAIAYLRGRYIPDRHYGQLYYTTNMFSWVNTIVPGLYKEKNVCDPRIIMPFFDANGRLTGVTGRSITKQGQRYYIAKIIDGSVAMFGLGSVKATDPSDIYALEGGFDAMFFDHSVASAGGIITTDLEQTGIDRRKFIVVYDNEMRKIDTVKKMELAIDQGYRVCIWPADSVDGKDINEIVENFVKSGRSPQEAVQFARNIVDENVFEGFRATVELGKRRRC